MLFGLKTRLSVFIVALVAWLNSVVFMSSKSTGKRGPYKKFKPRHYQRSSTTSPRSILRSITLTPMATPS